MFSHWELIVVLLVALLVFGKRLPDVARAIGRSIRSLKQGLHEADLNEPPDEAQDASAQGPSAQQSAEAAPEPRDRAQEETPSA